MSRTRRRHSIPYGTTAAGALLAALTTAAPVAAAPPSWTIAPFAGGGSRAATQDGRPYVYAEGAPGTVLEDKVAVTNPTAAPLSVTLRGAGPRGARTESGDTGAWITFARKSVRIPARTRAEIPFTLTVPAQATPGDHPGAIVAAGAGRTSEVGVHLRVSGPALSALTVEHVRVVAGDRIAYDVVNRGNTTLTPRLTVRADGLFGRVLDKGPRTLPVQLPPGRRARLSEPWRGAPAFDAVDVAVTVTAGGGARDSATASARFVPRWQLGGALVVLAGAGRAAHRLVRRRRRDRPGTGHPRSAP